MLKIKDSTGVTVGVLGDEDSAPQMLKKAVKAEGETEDATVGTVEEVGSGDPEAETATGD